MRGRKSSKRRILAVDVGGTRVKFEVSVQPGRREFTATHKLSAQRMVSEVKRLTKDWDYDVVSIGYPGLVMRGRIVAEPHNLGDGWVGFDFDKAFGRPVKILNDAAMQALGSYEGGRMLFLGLGTGLGTAMIFDNVIEPMELAHLPYRKGKTFEDYVGAAGLRRLGKKKWRKRVLDVIRRLTAALEPEYVVLDGGNAQNLGQLPRGVRMGATTMPSPTLINCGNARDSLRHGIRYVDHLDSDGGLMFDHACSGIRLSSEAPDASAMVGVNLGGIQVAWQSAP